MKKYLLIMLAVASVAFTACNQKPKEKEVTFQISVTDVTATNASVNVIPSDTNALYYYDVFTVEYFNELGSDEAVYADLKEYWEEVIAYYKELGYTYTLADFMSKGEDGWDYTGLTPNTQYYAIDFAVDSTYQLKGAITKVPFATEEVQNVTLLFEPALADTAIFFIPNNDKITYLPLYIDADTLAATGYTDEAYYEGYWEYMEQILTYYGYTLEDMAMYGQVYVAFSELEAGHSYKFMAKAYTDGVWNSDLCVLNFTAPAAAGAPAKIEKGGFDKQVRMKKAKKVQKMNTDFKAEKMAK